MKLGQVLLIFRDWKCVRTLWIFSFWNSRLIATEVYVTLQYFSGYLYFIFGMCGIWLLGHL